MKEQFVSYEIALKLKELEFDEECLGDYYIIPSDKTPNPNGEFLGLKYEDVSSYTKLVSAPLWQQVIDWFREKHNLHISVLPFKLNDKYDDVKLCWYYVVIDINRDGNITLNADSLNPSIENFNSYEEAREQAILKAIELIKK